jgi:hypothetical protein
MSTALSKDAAQRLIPGAYDRTTLTHRQPGSMGGGAFGSGTSSGPSSMDAATIAARALEGGGSARERRCTVTREPRRDGPALANVERDLLSGQDVPGGYVCWVVP